MPTYSNIFGSKTAQQKNSCSKVWLMDQLFIKLGSVTIDKLEFIMYRIKKDNWLSHHPEVKNIF